MIYAEIYEIRRTFFASQLKYLCKRRCERIKNNYLGLPKKNTLLINITRRVMKLD